MAHFAELDPNNTVKRVIVVDNSKLRDANGIESEGLGIAFCVSLFGPETSWVQTSYNRTFRKNYAGLGYIYDSVRDAFIPPKPYESWLLDEDTCTWQPPVPMPDDGGFYEWDESSQSWSSV